MTTMDSKTKSLLHDAATTIAAAYWTEGEDPWMIAEELVKELAQALNLGPNKTFDVLTQLIYSLQDERESL